MSDIREKIKLAIRANYHTSATCIADAVIEVLREQGPDGFYRLLNAGEIVRPTDEFMDDDFLRWLPAEPWTKGRPWHNGLKPMRRRTKTSDLVVPEALGQNPLRPDEGREDQYAHSLYVSGWNACRAAMLKYKGGE